jgi:valyl-tRNA synthetase
MNPDLSQRKNIGCGEIIVAVQPPAKCPKCGNTVLLQDPDTLDTWFSSGQWPYTTLGWGQEKSDKNTSDGGKLNPSADGESYDSSEVKEPVTDFTYFYPTSVMETGYEILFFWVARMIMLGLYSTGKVPFKTVYLHGLVRDAFGEKMSKSKGNVIDPLDVISKYGADSLRMALIYGTSGGADVKFGEKKIEAMRNFNNKLWNIGRFIKINLDHFLKKANNFEKNYQQVIKSAKTNEDKKILTQLKTVTHQVSKNLDSFQFAKAGEKLYEFIWHVFADKYIEAVKGRLRENDKVALTILIYVYTTCLRLLHPFIPFITEQITKQLLTEEEPLIISSWPK